MAKPRRRDYRREADEAETWVDFDEVDPDFDVNATYYVPKAPPPVRQDYHEGRPAAVVAREAQDRNGRRRNNYAGKCVRCGTWVDARAGWLTKDSSGKWAAEHEGDCPAPKPAPAAKPERAEPPEGIHLLDGVVYKVQKAVQGSGKLYCKSLDPDQGFVYQGRNDAFWRLSAATSMTLEQAKQYGALYGICCVCSRTLTDEGSIEAGIGPVCASRLG